MFATSHTRVTVFSVQYFPLQLFMIRHHTLLNERPLVSDSFSSLSGSSSHSCYVSLGRKKKKEDESRFFHFCPCFSAVSTTTEAENIPKKDLANGVGCCLGGCIIGVSGTSSQCLCTLDVCVCVLSRWRLMCVYVCMLACMHICIICI